ncbi:SAM-dependent methyltransferase [Putridiphycobacter roseus]|uniref:SAM-dependent methyltransferase n=1 Tax=Putridiphycobacter roseus TaxID=2219161 RepID=A0A2W1NK11_9FLAO|nr:class I SAM-dependent methyltransferase [Putridiphycobacter roseus]PZE15992.1 SAM-dependent methyltransferase [Putridiphycobacter roseus]
MKKIYKYLLNNLPRPMLIRLSYVFRVFAPLVYKGDKVECPVCEHKFRKFLSYGSDVAHRDNVLCPYDLTLERHRVMWLYLKQKTDFFTKPDLKVMHIAPEQCFHGKFKKQKNLDYVTGDLLSPIADLHFDLHDIPLEDNQYEVIFCNHVMEHVKDDLQCMKELYRIMKPGGWGIMQVPIDTSRTTTYEDWSITTPEEREKHFWQYDHVRLYGLNYPDRLREAGFNVEVVDFSKELPTEVFERYRIPKSEVLYIVSK